MTTVTLLLMMMMMMMMTLVATETVSDVLVRSDRLKAAILSDIDRRSDSLGLETSPRTLHTEIIAEYTI